MLQNLPQDPVILLSVINTKLRDFYPSLDQLCKEMEVNKKELTEDYIDLVPILERLYINAPEFLKPIKKVEVRYAS